jgi:hypothetical protein
MAGEIDHMLAGAAADLNHIAGFPDEESLQHGPDRLMVAVKCRRVEPAIGFDWPAILTEFNDIFSHARLPGWFGLAEYSTFPGAPQDGADIPISRLRCQPMAFML